MAKDRSKSGKESHSSSSSKSPHLEAMKSSKDYDKGSKDFVGKDIKRSRDDAKKFQKEEAKNGDRGTT